MSLARVKTWNPGDVLTAADLNSEFNNVLNNPISLISPTTGVITFTTAQTFPSNQVTGSLTAAGSQVRGLNGTLSSQSGTFTANQYLLQSTTGTQSFVLNSTASFAVSVGTAGPAAGGRDIAAVFASTYVHWYAISTGSGSTALAGIVSTATPPTGPVMPANYSAWAYLGGSVYTSNSTTILQAHSFRGNWAHYSTQIVEVFNGNTTVETAVSMANTAPPNHQESQHSLHTLLVPSNGQKLIIRVVTAADYHASSTVASAVTAIYTADIRLPNLSNQYFYLYSSQLASAADGLAAFMHAYKMPNGGG